MIDEMLIDDNFEKLMTWSIVFDIWFKANQRACECIALTSIMLLFIEKIKRIALLIRTRIRQIYYCQNRLLISRLDYQIVDLFTTNFLNLLDNYATIS